MQPIGAEIRRTEGERKKIIGRINQSIYYHLLERSKLSTPKKEPTKQGGRYKQNAPRKVGLVIQPFIKQICSELPSVSPRGHKNEPIVMRVLFGTLLRQRAAAAANSRPRAGEPIINGPRNCRSK